MTEAHPENANQESGTLKENLRKVTTERDQLRVWLSEAAEMSGHRLVVETGDRSEDLADLKAEVSGLRSELREKEKEIDGLKAELSALQAEAAADSRQWYIRSADGAEFGPVKTEALVGLAAGCRVGPDHEVSTDMSTWVPAHGVEELGMQWTVMLDENTPYGPLNRNALLLMLESGDLNASMVVKDSQSEKTITLAELKAID